MSAEKPGLRERRLGAIMFTDVVGYTSITAKDEAKALRVLDEYRAQLESVFPKFDGRVVKTMGDGFLVEFASAVEAVNCGVEAQHALETLNSKRQDDPIKIRIGIHVGDIVHSGGDVLGDAVNIASRVEPLAEPGGIALTRQVVDQIQGKVEWGLRSMGERNLKNVPYPVEVFSVESVRGARPAESAAQAPSHKVAILPFTNLSPDPNDRYFADGLTEELISTISRIGDLSVISRGSAMRYRDTKLSPDQVGKELGVGAVLEGSVRKAGNKVRIAAQLLEVRSDKYVWSRSYDRDLTDIFGVQEEIAVQVAEGLKMELLARDRETIGKKTTENSEAYTLYLKGRYYWNERSQEGTKKAIRYFEEAVKLDPGFAVAYSGLADCYLILADYQWASPASSGEQAIANARKALSIDPDLAEAHASLGLTVINHHWDFVTGERELRTAIRLNPNLVQAYHWYGSMLFFKGNFEEGSAMVRQGLKLDPFSQVLAQAVGVALYGMGRNDDAKEEFRKLEAEGSMSASVHYWLNLLHLAMGNYDQAVEEAKKEVEANQGEPGTKLDLAVALGMSGRFDEARRLIEEVVAVRDGYVSPCTLGTALLASGRKDEGYAALGRAFAEHDSSLLYFRCLPTYAKLREDPRWREIDVKMGSLSSVDRAS